MLVLRQPISIDYRMKKNKRLDNRACDRSIIRCVLKLITDLEHSLEWKENNIDREWRGREMSEFRINQCHRIKYADEKQTLMHLDEDQNFLQSTILGLISIGSVPFVLVSRD